MKPIPEQQARMDRATREIYAALPSRAERIERLERMAAEYNDDAYDGPAWLRALGQLDVAMALKMEGE